MTSMAKPSASISRCNLTRAVDVDVADGDPRSLGRKPAAAGRPDSACPAGDERCLARQSHALESTVSAVSDSARPDPRRPSPIQMWEWIARPIPFLERCNRTYGDMFTVRFPVGTIIFISDPEVIKEIFTGDPDVLHAGEANATPLEPLMGKNSVLLLDGPEHMRQRKLMLPSFHGERMQRYGDLMREITEEEIRRWPHAEPFPLRPRTQAITLEIIMRAVFGIEDAERLEQLRGRLGRLLDIGMQPTALASIVLPPLRKTIGRRTWERFQRLRSDVDEVLYDEIARRRTASDIAERTTCSRSCSRRATRQGKPLTDVELRDELITLLVAGHETTATTLAWAFDLLLRHPRELARLQAEIEAGEGGEYLDAVIKETLRIRPVVPGVVRKLTAPLEVDGHHFPAGIRLAPNIYLTHRRADVYPEPERFQPERFLEQPRRHLLVDPVRRRHQAVPRRKLRALRAEGRDPDHHPQRHPARRGRPAGADPPPRDHVRACARRDGESRSASTERDGRRSATRRPSPRNGTPRGARQSARDRRGSGWHRRTRLRVDTALGARRRTGRDRLSQRRARRRGGRKGARAGTRARQAGGRPSKACTTTRRSSAPARSFSPCRSGPRPRT